jgi:hypothetical protein
LKEEALQMSFNQILKDTNALSFNISKKLLTEGQKNFFSAKTRSDQALIESRIITPELLDEDLKAKLLPATAFQQADVQQFEMLQQLFSTLHAKNIGFEEVLRKNITRRLNEIESKKIEIAGNVAELKQRLSSLVGFSEGFKFVLKEDFYNLYNISKELVSKAQLNIDLESNTLTLPVDKSTKVRVGKLYISNKSRGIPGNYLTGKNKLIYSIIDKNEDTFFEFFKLGSGPARLVITAQLVKTSIINQVKISKAFASASSSFVIKDIKFNTTKSKSVSVKKLMDVNHQSLSVTAINKNAAVTITHLPVVAESISIEIESNEYTITNDNVKMFIIGLKDIEFKTIKYKSEGEFGSSRIVTPENLFLLNCQTTIFPQKNKSYTEEVSISTDNGASRDLLSLINNKSKDMILNGRQNFINYIYRLKKRENLVLALENYSNDQYFIKTDSILKTVNKKLSPVTYSVPSTAVKETLNVVQSKVLRRDNLRGQAIKIGAIKDIGTNSIEMPISLKKLGLSPDELVLYGNNIPLTQVDAIDDLVNAEQFYVDYDTNLLKFNLPESKIVNLSLLINTLKPKITLKNEGYYIELDEPFEYDKRLIKIEVMSNSGDQITELIPKGSVDVFLKGKRTNLIKMEREDVAGSSWHESEDYKTLSAEAGMYKLLLEEHSSLQHRVTYTTDEAIQLSSDQFEIWGKDAEIKGVYLYPEAVKFNDIVETILNQEKVVRLSSRNIIEGTVAFSTPGPFSAPYKEVAFIDGYTEFLNVKKIEADYLPRMEWLNDEVTFTTMHQPYLEGTYSGSVELFRNGVLLSEHTHGLAPGSTRIYTVQRPDTDLTSTTAEMLLKYYYLEEVSSDIKKYSIDYTKGVLYFSDLPDEETSISYKYGNIELSYNLYNKINNFSYDASSNIVNVYSEEFLPYNNSLRILWHKNEVQFEIAGLEDYYSPILYNLTVGMN